MTTTENKITKDKALELVEKCVEHGILQEHFGCIVCALTCPATAERELILHTKEEIAEKIIRENSYNTLAEKLNRKINNN